MKHHIYRRILGQSASMALLMLVLTACGLHFPWEHPAHTRHASVEKHRYTPAAFVEHVTLAELALPPDAADVSVAKEELDALRADVTQKPGKLQRQAIVMLDYTAGGSRLLQQIAAPIPIPPGDDDFSSLMEILQALGNTPYVLHNLRLASVSVAPLGTLRKTLKSPDAPVGEVRQALAEQQQAFLDSAKNLPLLDDAQAQLQLLSFFIDHNFRDAAYLSADNVKRLLAVATQKQPQDSERIRGLSQRLDDLESQLHKTMPFTL